MRKNYLLIAFVSLLVCSCKKETNELINPSPPATVDQSAQSVIGPGCFGNNWTDGGGFNGYNFNFWPVLVYNNKAYAFNSPAAGNITVFDGSTWTTKSTNIPWSFTWVDFAFVIGNKGYVTWVIPTGWINSAMNTTLTPIPGRTKELTPGLTENMKPFFR